jgi:subtilase family serine protease
MQQRSTLAALLVATGIAAFSLAVGGAAAVPATAGGTFTLEAPGGPVDVETGATPCTGPIHCYTPAEIRAAYGVDQVAQMGQGQTIVLVDSYGSPTATNDLQVFHDTFFPSLPNPDFVQVFPNGKTDFNNSNGNGKSGSNGAAGWSGEATLDIEWAYAIAPLAHIVLIAVPPAETEGVQGFPNLFKAISDQIDANPAGTVFSMSFGITEQTFGGAAATQAAKFDAVFQKGIARGDTFFAASGDDGTLGTLKQNKNQATASVPTAGWPASSPYVTAVGGTQLQDGWAWDPQGDTPFNADGSFNGDYFNSTSPAGTQNVVWNESWLPAASGGGPSDIYTRPAWQNGVLTSAGDHRLVPDVAWNAAVNGGVLVYITAYPDYNNGAGFHIYGGTSAATPQVAALTALANEARHEASPSKGPLGNINPLLYAHPGWFTDVLPTIQGTAESGKLVDNNDWDYNGDGNPVTRDPVAGWPVLPGYDMTTGLGTPNAPAYVNGLLGS